MRDASVSNGASSVPPALLAGLTMRLPLSPASDEAMPAGAAQADPFIGRALDGKYRIERRIGRGGSGTVYRARHLLIHRAVAVKVLSLDLVADEDALARFRREAAMAGQLKHFNIVSVTDFGITPDGVAYLVMDFVEGKSLRRALSAEGTIAAEKLVRWMKPICSAVHAAHRRGIIHRDLKPDNVMIEVVDDEEIPRVLDFGIAKLMDAFAVNSDFNTETGSVMGTPHYMSPEQCEGKPLDPRSDIYSLGTLVYELLTGNVPFPGKVTTTVMMQQVTATPRPLRDLRPDLPEAVELCVMRALSKNPSARQATALDLALELEAALASAPSPKKPSDGLISELAEAPPLSLATDFRAQLREAAAVAAALSPPRPATPVKSLTPGVAAVRALAEQRAATVKLAVELPDAAVAPPVTPVCDGVAPDSEKGRRAALPNAALPNEAPNKPASTSVSPASRPSPSPLASLPLAPELSVTRPRLDRAQLWRRARAAAALAGLALIGYAVATYLTYRQSNADLERRLVALAQDRSYSVATLRDRALALLAERGLSAESVRIRLDPPNQQVFLRARYRRSILGLTLRFQAEGAATVVPMTLDMLADLPAAQVEVVNVSPRELDRYRAERRQRAAGGETSPEKR
ncbi:MAG: hypothetical protein CFK52_11725 [Chloracidobacterium sp. CP2_5A]|nr:MAG: hypothetical protein CFK52_11725 [Chloracidobacterium sp. CP2_5A]